MNSATNYMIIDENSVTLAQGIEEHRGDVVAQQLADKMGRSVWLHVESSETDDTDEGEEYAPSGEGYSATADDLGPSSVSDAPARDVEVTLTLPSGETVTASCTLWPRADGRPGYGTSGTPMDGWMGGCLVAAVRKMHDKARAAAVEAILDAAASACAEAAS